MEMTAGVDLEVPGHPIGRAAATHLKGPLQAWPAGPRSGPRAGSSCACPQQLQGPARPTPQAEPGTAGDRRRHPAAAAELARRRVPLERGLSRAAALGPHRCVSLPGTAGSGWPGCIGGRAYLQLCRWDPRLPGPAATAPAVALATAPASSASRGRRSQSRGVAGAEHAGRKSGSFGNSGGELARRRRYSDAVRCGSHAAPARRGFRPPPARPSVPFQPRCAPPSSQPGGAPGRAAALPSRSS